MALLSVHAGNVRRSVCVRVLYRYEELACSVCPLVLQRRADGRDLQVVEAMPSLRVHDGGNAVWIRLYFDSVRRTITLHVSDGAGLWRIWNDGVATGPALLPARDETCTGTASVPSTCSNGVFHWRLLRACVSRGGHIETLTSSSSSSSSPLPRTLLSPCRAMHYTVVTAPFTMSGSGKRALG